MTDATPIPVVFLIGPTAAGKTDLALQLAGEYPFEIVSVDSAMIYRGLDIGTGKPAPEVLRATPHHLVDILDPSESYSAGQFVRDAQRSIEAIRARGKLPLLVGGTMLYFKALTQGIAELPAANAGIRREIDAQAASVGWPAMHAELARIDPLAAQRIQPNDAQRIQRALEVYRLTGQPLTALHRQSVRQSLSLDAFTMVWSPSDRSILGERIAARFESMMAAGFLEEVRELFVRGDLSPDLPSLRSVGYRQLWGYLAGAYDLAEARRLGVIATRQLARRQLIWLRALPDLRWFDSLNECSVDEIRRSIDEFLARQR